MPYSWKQLSIVALTAVAVLAGADLYLHSIFPIRQLREVEDGMGDLKRKDPDILVLGSSHARTFHVLGQHLEQRTQGRVQLVDVPVENGKFISYDWVLRHRIAPAIESPDGRKSVRYQRIKQLVLVTEWFDSCDYFGGVYWNIPSRAWSFHDFAADALRGGLGDYNRNYLQNQIRRALSASTLYYDRLQTGPIDRLVHRLKGQPDGLTPEKEAARIAEWRKMVEAGESCIGAKDQMDALKDILDLAQRWDLKTTIVLFPRKPATLSDRAKATTVLQFAALMRKGTADRNVSVIDMTVDSPLRDEDFMQDFDHVNAEGNAAFAEWALNGQLAFLLDPSQSAAPESALRAGR